MVLSTPEAMPESAVVDAVQHAIVIGMKTRAMPIGMNMMNGKMSVQ